MPPRKPKTPDIDAWKEGFNKNFGDGTLTEGTMDRSVVSTGSLVLDYALGVGGYVEGRLYEMWGEGNIGKTTFACLGLAEAQKAHPEKYVGVIDVEQTFDPSWAGKLGVDRDRLMVYSPRSAEDVADSMKEFTTQGLFSMVMLDSIGAMISQAEKEKDADEATVGKVPGIVTRMVKIAASEARASGTIVLLLNQVRANIAKFGPAQTTGGGFALKHATTGKFYFKKTGTPPLLVRIDGEDTPVGRELGIKVERNKCAPSGRVAAVMMKFEATEKYGPLGVDQGDEAFTIGVRSGVIQRAGAWYTITTTGERFNGRDAVIAHFVEEPSSLADVRAAALEAISHEVIPVDRESDDGEPEVKGEMVLSVRSGIED